MHMCIIIRTHVQCKGVRYIFFVYIPIPHLVLPIVVTINTTDEQIVGQPLTLECRIQRANDIDSTFDIIWTRRSSGEVRRVKNVSGSLISNYSDFYNISVLRRSDNFASYHCDVIINLNQPLNTSVYFDLNNVTRKF